jgi:hypothetical protein
MEFLAESRLLFYCASVFILLHEMDAVHKKEWRIFPGLNRLDDEMGYRVFTWAHVPLYLLFFWGIWGQHGAQQGVMIGMDIFYLAHLGAHILLRNHPKNLFRGFTSWAFIVGAAVFGGLDLLFR